MSAAPRTKQGVWYKDHYDKIAVVVVLVALLGSALFLLLQINQAHRDLRDTGWDRVVENEADRIDLAEFEAFVSRLEQPFMLTVRAAPFAVSDLRVRSSNPDIPTPIPYGTEVCPWTGFVEPELEDPDTTGDGIPDSWFVQFGLDPFDVELPFRDLDGDGFTVREEFEAGTNPVDPEDHPSYAYKLRVLRTGARPFGLRFQGIQELGPDDRRFMLNMRHRDRSFFAQMGEVVEGYRLVGFEERTRQGPLGPVDGSILKLERQADSRVIELTVNVDYNLSEPIAELLFLVDDSARTVRVGDDISLMEQEFKVIDIRRDHVLIRDEAREEDVTVGMRTREEDLPDAPGSMSSFEELLRMGLD